MNSSTTELERLISKSLSKHLSSNETNELIRYLRQMDQSAACALLKDFGRTKSWIDYSVARRVLNDKQLVQDYFTYCAQSSDASTIYDALQFGIPKLGFRKVVWILRSIDTRENRILEKASYWLPKFVGNNHPNNKNKDLMDQVRQLVKSQSR